MKKVVMETPSFIEDYISQISALQLLIKLGYCCLTPDEALEAKSNRSSNVLMEKILKQQLQKIIRLSTRKKFTTIATNIISYEQKSCNNTET
jgi:type I restriction enzyme R subunit